MPPSGHTGSDSFPLQAHSEEGELEGDQHAENDKKNREMEDESIVERQSDVGIVKSRHLLSKRCGPDSVLGA